jgi:hypothetical protein
MGPRTNAQQNRMHAHFLIIHASARFTRILCISHGFCVKRKNRQTRSMAIRRAATAKGFQDERYRALVEQLILERTRQRLSQRELGDRLGLHQQFVSRYELGERRLDVVEFADVSRALGLVPADLIGTIS